MSAGLVLMAVLSFGSAAAAASGMALALFARRHVLFSLRGKPVTADAFFGLLGFFGCFASAVALCTSAVLGVFQ